MSQKSVYLLLGIVLQSNMRKWFKKDTDIVLDCYTYNPYAYNFAKVNHGSYYIPEWWKKTPRHIENSLTIKDCPAIIEYYKKGIVIPMWCEFEFIINPKGHEDLFTWKSSQNDFSVAEHAQEQFKGFTKADGHNIKIASPWYIKCREDIKFTFTQPVWSQRNTMFNFVLTPGIVSFKSQMECNLNYFYEQTDKRQVINISALTPVAIMHAMSDRKIKLNHHLVTSRDSQGNKTLGHPSHGLFLNTPLKLLSKRKKKLFEKIDSIEEGPFV